LRKKSKENYISNEEWKNKEKKAKSDKEKKNLMAIVKSTVRESWIKNPGGSEREFEIRSLTIKRKKENLINYLLHNGSTSK